MLTHLTPIKHENTNLCKACGTPAGEPHAADCAVINDHEHRWDGILQEHERCAICRACRQAPPAIPKAQEVHTYPRVNYPKWNEKN